jgi:hypothetical protein
MAEDRGIGRSETTRGVGWSRCRDGGDRPHRRRRLGYQTPDRWNSRSWHRSPQSPPEKADQQRESRRWDVRWDAPATVNDRSSRVRNRSRRRRERWVTVSHRLGNRSPPSRADPKEGRDVPAFPGTAGWICNRRDPRMPHTSWSAFRSSTPERAIPKSIHMDHFGRGLFREYRVKIPGRKWGELRTVTNDSGRVLAESELGLDALPMSNRE